MDQARSAPDQRWPFLRTSFVRIVIGIVLTIASYFCIEVYTTSHREHRIARVIESHGGTVDIQYCGPDWIPVSYRDKWTFFDRVAGIDIANNAVPVDILREIRLLTSLTGLRINDTQCADVGVERLTGLTSLHVLDLTDDGLECLQSLQKLERLSLNRTQVTDAGLRHLGAFSNLRCLDLHYSSVTNAGLHNLRNLDHLEILDLSGTNITDAGMEPLKGLPNLRWIGLNGTRVSSGARPAHWGLLPSYEFEAGPVAPMQ